MVGRLFGFVLVLGLTASSAFADWSKIKSSEFEIDDPPAEGSAAYKRDFKLLHDHEKTRTKEQCQQADDQEFYSVENFFGGDESPLTKKQLKEVKKSLEKVFKFSERVARYYKDQYERPRPYNVDETLTPCVKDPPKGNKAYPSSHAAVAATSACVLAAAYPEKKDALLALGKALGDLRVIVGVHHPSDVEAGQALGEAICERLLSEDDFREEWGI